MAAPSAPGSPSARESQVLRARRYGRRHAPQLVLLLASASCAPATVASPPSLSSAVDGVMAEPPLDQVHWGVLALDAGSGTVLYRQGAERKFIPASNMKLPVTVAALHHLGPGYRFETALLAAGPFDAATGVLKGDLVLPATGDPTLSARFWESDVAPLRALADSLRAAGLREVTGSLVVDASSWDSSTVVGSWMVGDLPRSYAATGGAFALAEGVTTVVVTATAPGEPARVSWEPRGEEGFVLGRVETVGADVEASRIRTGYLPESRRLVLDGEIEAGAVDTLRLATRDPVRQAAAALTRALAEGGVEVKGGWRVAWTAGSPLAGGCATGDLDGCGARRLAALSSPPMIRIVEEVLEPSQNWIAEQLVRVLGPLRPRAPGGEEDDEDEARSSWRSGLATVRAFLIDEVGVDSLDFQLRDGSGLSTQNLLTPRALVALLGHARREPWGDAFRDALPEPGEEDGTLEGRLESLQGRLHAKTGTLTNVVSLSGYLDRPDGSTVLFSILTNGSGLPSSVVRGGMDRIVRILADGPGRGGGSASRDQTPLRSAARAAR